ncbi:MAG: hypothetical protein HC897_13175 [Thermoanaerobaculia bacterium]|nr:hypothetical protein [Thermoanaerobaculia bacterium]
MIWVAMVLVAVAASSAAAPERTRLVGTGDTLWQEPPGVLVDFAQTPHVAGRYVVFYAGAFAGNEFLHGVWLFDGEVFHRVVDSTMPEGQAGVLTNQIYAVDETGLVAVNVEAYAMLGWKDGVLFPIALDGGVPPGGPPGSVFFGFSHPVFKDGTVYFLGGLTNLPVNENIRIYAWSTDLGLREIPIAGLCCFSIPAPASDALYLWAADPLLQPQEGFTVFRRAQNGSLEEYFRLNSQFPGAPPGATWIPNVEQLGVVSDAIVLNAEDSFGTTSGLFRVTPNLVEPVMMRGDPVPSTGEPLAAVLREYSSSGDRIAFMATWLAPTCACDLVVQEPDRSLRSIVADGDLLGGLPIGFLHITYGALSGDRLVFDAQQPGDTAVWLADLEGPPDLEVPTLGTLGVVVLGSLLALLGIVYLRHRGAA